MDDRRKDVLAERNGSSLFRIKAEILLMECP